MSEKYTLYETNDGQTNKVLVSENLLDLCRFANHLAHEPESTVDICYNTTEGEFIKVRLEYGELTVFRGCRVRTRFDWIFKLTGKNL